MKKQVTYTIEDGVDEEGFTLYALYSHVPTNFGGDAKNFVAYNHSDKELEVIADKLNWTKREEK